MFLELNPLRFGAMFSPIWLFLAPSLWLYWDEWMRKPLTLALVGGLPIIAGVLAATWLRGRWRLEISSKGLIHHTLMRTELFEWQRMGLVSVQQRGPKGFFSALVFAYPLDDDAPQAVLSRAIGRSILAIFGNMKPRDLAALVNSHRYAHLVKVGKAL